jgi:phage repressor protein C with HTH and peptisase S24 domain
MPIPDNLKRLREERRLSQPRLAELAGVTQQLISQLERGENLTTRKLPQIARALGVQAHDIDESYNFHAAAGAIQSVRLISWVSAGALTSSDAETDTEDAPIILEPGLDPNGDWIALRVDGDSMNRISPHDSVIFVNRRERQLVPNACYIIGDGNGGATYKRYRPPNIWEPVSTNPAHKPIVLPPGEEPDIIGRVRKTVLTM